PTLLYSFSLHGALPIFIGIAAIVGGVVLSVVTPRARLPGTARRFFITVMAGLALGWLSFGALVFSVQDRLVFSPRGLSPSRLERDRKSTRLNSSHVKIS